jgi:hypothetical protein
VNTSVPIQNEPPRGSIAATQPAEENDIIPPRAPEAVRPKAPDREQGGGSIDLSSKEGKRILPRGLSTAPKVNANISLVEQGGIPIGDVLKHLGLDAAPEDAGWRVTSVTGAAERSGFKTGDVIEAINDRSLVKRTSLTGTVSSKTVRVRRDGKVIVVTLKP